MTPNSKPHPFSGVTFHPATPGDFEELFALRIAALRENLERIGQFDLEDSRARLRKSFFPEHTRFIVADGQRIGFYTFRPAENGFHLHHLYVLPACQRRGLGSYVLGLLLQRADEGQMPVYLGALRDSPSNRFYLRHGFVPANEDARVIYYVRPPQAASE